MSDLLARLIAAGTPVDLVAEVANELAMAKARIEVANEAERALEIRRENDRLRKREQRERERENSHVTSQEVTGRHGTSRDNPALSPSPNENNSNPHPHTHPEKNTTRARGTRLPVDWVPEPLTGDAAKAIAQWPPGALERELARFRDWAASASGPNAVKKDWQAAWRNWLRKAHDEGRYLKNGHPDRNPSRWSPSAPASGNGLAEVLRQRGTYDGLGFDR